MPHTFDNKIIIIGSGPGALSCAYDLLKNGYKPLIIERGSKAGGFMQSICYKDYQVDLPWEKGVPETAYQTSLDEISK